MTCVLRARARRLTARRTKIGKMRKIAFRRFAGFTFIEIMVVLTLVAILAGIAAPVITSSIQRGREAALKEDLAVMRKAIDDYHADNGSYPEDINKLVEKRYLRKIPMDPMTERSDTWREIRDDRGITDIQSGSDGNSSSEEAYRDW